VIRRVLRGRAHSKLIAIAAAYYYCILGKQAFNYG